MEESATSPKAIVVGSSWRKNPFLLIIIAVFIIFLLLILYFYSKNGEFFKREVQVRMDVGSRLSTNIQKGSYETRKNADQSTDYFVKGNIEKITEEPNAIYSVTIKSTATNNSQIIQFSLPKYPPKNNQSVLGKDFKEMFEKGFKLVNLRIKYDKYNRFLEWEML